MTWKGAYDQANKVEREWNARRPRGATGATRAARGARRRVAAAAVELRGPRAPAHHQQGAARVRVVGARAHRGARDRVPARSAGDVVVLGRPPLQRDPPVSDARREATGRRRRPLGPVELHAAGAARRVAVAAVGVVGDAPGVRPRLAHAGGARRADERQEPQPRAAAASADDADPDQLHAVQTLLLHPGRIVAAETGEALILSRWSRCSSTRRCPRVRSPSPRTPTSRRPRRIALAAAADGAAAVLFRRDDFAQEGPTGPIEAKQTLALSVGAEARLLVTFEVPERLVALLGFGRRRRWPRARAAA